MKTLRESLTYEPVVLQFGTSGRRGNVVDLTQLEIYINATAELEYLLSKMWNQGGIKHGDEFYFAYDLRPSSTAFVVEEKGRGELAQAIVQAIKDAGMVAVNMGAIPTPALTCYAIGQKRGSIMVTGSHIPFSRNGYKTNTSLGELLKTDEEPIGKKVDEVRARIYVQPVSESLFDEMGMLKIGHQELPEASDVAKSAYLERYKTFFSGERLEGKRILVYQHSAVGRDLLAQMLEDLGAEVIAAGRSDTFVPIDTENIDDAQLAIIQKLADEANKEHGQIDAVVSLDGDSDRPLMLGALPNSKLRFYGGDILGMVVAEFLGADSVVVPISCNDGIDRGKLRDKLEPKTKIGSPYVIAGMQKAAQEGKTKICGWEANGGFLTGSDFLRNGHKLTALPTRDAFLPILSTLFSAQAKGEPVTALFDALPKRYSKAALLKDFPKATSKKIVEWLTPKSDDSGDLNAIKAKLAPFFTKSEGFDAIKNLDYTDGVRISFENGDIAHIRPSGNADELRIYAVADTQARADEIARLGVDGPDAILRKLEKAVG
jgi:phosphomannomutase